MQAKQASMSALHLIQHEEHGPGCCVQRSCVLLAEHLVWQQHRMLRN
jgi:hypothetical protein